MLVKEIANNKPTIKRSGLIPFVVEDGEIKMMFMVPSNPAFGGNQFQIAKGRLEPDLTPLANAIKEATEELGLKEPNMVGEPFHVGDFMRGIAIFAVEVKDKNDFGPFTYETGKVGWLSKDEFVKVGRELHHVAVLSTHRKINSYLQTKG